MFLYLTDRMISCFGLLPGMICVLVIITTVGFCLFFVTILICKKFEKQVMIALITLSVVWCGLLIYFAGGFVKHQIFVYLGLSCAVTVSSGVLIFVGIFSHRLLMYIMCCMSFFLIGLPLSLGPLDSFIYDLAKLGLKNTEQVVEWGCHHMLVVNDDKERLNLAHRIRLHATKPIQRGLAELCLQNRHEAATFFALSDADAFLKEIIRYCDSGYDSLLFKNVDKEMFYYVNLIEVTPCIDTKQQFEKRMFKLLSERYLEASSLSHLVIKIKCLIFISLIWGQIITIPMIMFRDERELI